MTHYVVSPDGTVRKYSQKSFATAMLAQLPGTIYATDADLKAIPTPLLVILHNLIRPEKKVVRFADRATAEKRLQGVLEVLAKPGEAPTAVEGAQDEGSTETTAPTAEEIAAENALDELPLTPEEFTPDPTKSDQENAEMATKARSTRNAARRAAKGGKKGAKKSTGAKRAPAVSIPESTVRKVIKMRAAGEQWPAILKELGEKSNNFIHRIRPLMKKLDKSSVMAIGPGSANYGKAVKKGKKGGK